MQLRYEARAVPLRCSLIFRNVVLKGSRSQINSIIFVDACRIKCVPEKPTGITHLSESERVILLPHKKKEKGSRIPSNCHLILLFQHLCSFSREHRIAKQETLKAFELAELFPSGAGNESIISFFSPNPCGSDLKRFGMEKLQAQNNIMSFRGFTSRRDPFDLAKQRSIQLEMMVAFAYVDTKVSPQEEKKHIATANIMSSAPALFSSPITIHKLTTLFSYTYQHALLCVAKKDGGASRL